MPGLDPGIHVFRTLEFSRSCKLCAHCEMQNTCTKPSLSLTKPCKHLLNTNSPLLAAHCDWSVSPSKRWMAVGMNHGNGWLLFFPEQVKNTSHFFEHLHQRVGRESTIIAGFDFPIGLPWQYGWQTGMPDFKTFLAQLGKNAWSRWFDVAETRADISIHRPFYPQRPGSTKQHHLFEALGLPDRNALLRACEHATSERNAACMLFWTLGGNQVGKAALSGWRDILMPNLDKAAFWPFDGCFTDLKNSKRRIIAETYPANVYPHIGISRLPRWSKRKQEGRKLQAQRILNHLDRSLLAIDDELRRYIDDGFGSAGCAEDQFDAFTGLLGMIDVIDGRLKAAPVLDDKARMWEGWIFGQN
jgi:hypothetical protein